MSAYLQRVPVHWLLNDQVWVFLSGLYLEEALELEGHHLPVITWAYWEGHPVAGGFGQHARWGWLAELRPRVARTSLGGQKRVQVRHCAFPVLIIVGGKTNRSILLCRHGLPRLWRPVVGRAFVTPAVPVMVKTPYPSCRCCRSVLVTVSLLSPTKLMVFLGQRALRVGNWNVVPLSTSHNGSAIRVTYIKKEYINTGVHWNPWIVIRLCDRQKGKQAHTCTASTMKTSTEGYVQKHQTASPSPTHTRNQEQNSSSSPLCCEKVDNADISLQSFASDRAPGPRSSSQSTSHCTLVSSKVSGFHVPMSVVLPRSRAEHQFTSAHDAQKKSKTFGATKHQWEILKEDNMAS